MALKTSVLLKDKRGFSFNTEGYSFKPFSVKGVPLKISRSTKLSKDKTFQIIKSVQLPTRTRHVKILYKGKTVGYVDFKKSLKKKRGLGAKSLSKFVSKAKPRRVKYGKKRIELETLAEYFKGLGIEWNRINSGYLPGKPFVHKSIFVFDQADYFKQYKKWRGWVAIKGDQSSGDDEEDEDNEEGAWWNLVSFDRSNDRPIQGKNFLPDMQSLLVELIETVTEQHNLKLANREVKSRWFKDGFIFLGIEGLG